MKQIIFMAILLATGIASAQNKAVISADETSFDFGTIKEANGNVSQNKEYRRSTVGLDTCHRLLWLYDTGMDKGTDSSG